MAVTSLSAATLRARCRGVYLRSAACVRVRVRVACPPSALGAVDMTATSEGGLALLMYRRVCVCVCVCVFVCVCLCVCVCVCVMMMI